MSFNCYFRAAINPVRAKHRRVSALRSCISYLTVFDNFRGFTKWVQHFEDAYGVSLRACDSEAISEEILMRVLMAVVRERNLKLEAQRREATLNLRRKLNRKAHARKAVFVNTERNTTSLTLPEDVSYL